MNFVPCWGGKARFRAKQLSACYSSTKKQVKCVEASSHKQCSSLIGFVLIFYAQISRLPSSQTVLMRGKRKLDAPSVPPRLSLEDSSKYAMVICLPICE